MVAKAVLYSMFTLTASAFILYAIYIVFTPVMNSFFNSINSYLAGNPGAVSSGGKTFIQNLEQSAILQWSILITLSIAGCGAIIWIVIYRDEPVESNEEFEY